MRYITIGKREKPLPNNETHKSYQKLVKSTGGSRHLCVGSLTQLEELNDFYFTDVNYYFVLKSDVLLYLKKAREEYLNPTQNYRYTEYSSLWSKFYVEIMASPNKYWKCKMQRGMLNDQTRYYIEQNDNYPLDRAYDIIYQMMISTTPRGIEREKLKADFSSNYTTLIFTKIKDLKTNKCYIRMKPDFTKRYTVDELSSILEREYNANPQESSIISFGMEFASIIISNSIDVEQLLKNARIASAEKARLLKETIESFKKIVADKATINPIDIEFPELEEIANTNDSNIIYYQRIYYGAPGTGKSNEIKELTGKGKDGILFDKDCTFRTTFHPDSDYASFVGAYKPYWDKAQEKIVYGYRPQSFLKAYIKAWRNPEKQVALVVEEINRGNCAQIFGDIFQLLDREKSGLSKYPIECDVEMQELLKKELANDSDLWGSAVSDSLYAGSKDNINVYYSAHYDNAFDKIKNGEILTLPMNLSILATMNTSDQSLFPMDSAFKRRWEWIYEPIVKGIDKDTDKELEWKIELGKYKLSADEEEKECVVDWWDFLQKINAVIYSLTSSEDKQLGYFFCQPDKEDGVTISKKLFVGKVIFYLWNEIFKDYAFEHDVCKKENKSETLYFADFYEGKNLIKQTSLETFFKHLKDFGNKEVKLIEEKVATTPAPETSIDDATNQDDTPTGATPEQN